MAEVAAADSNIAVFSRANVCDMCGFVALVVVCMYIYMSVSE